MRILFAALLMAALALGGAGCARAYRDYGEAPAPPPPPTTERNHDVTIHTFSNGLTLIHRRSAANAIAGVSTYIHTGASEDDARDAGLTNLMMRTMQKGTTSRSAEEIAEQLALLGAGLGTSAGQDFCKASIQCLTEDLGPAMEIFADVLLNATFPDSELELERKKVLASIRMGQDQNSVVASRRLNRELFGEHAYGRPVEGLAETVQALPRAMIATRHRASFLPGNMVMAVVCNAEFEEVRAIVEANFPKEAPTPKRRFTADKIIAPSASRTEILKNSEQAFVLLGVRLCGEGDPDEPAIEVASTILGSGMSSRLFSELRDRRGLAYAVGAYPVFHRYQGYLAAYIGTKPENATLRRTESKSHEDRLAALEELGFADQAERLRESGDRDFEGRLASLAEEGLWNEIERLRESAVLPEELERAKNYIAGDYLRSHERNMNQAGYLAWWHITGRGVEYDARYLDSIRAVTSRDIMRVANKYFLDPTAVVVRPPDGAAAGAGSP